VSGASIREFLDSDLKTISSAMGAYGSDKPADLYRRYFEDQVAGRRNLFVAEWEEVFCGYVTVVWQSHYGPFRDQGIPEIADLNVVPPYRRRGIGSELLDTAEFEISYRSEVAGIGVGLDAGYGVAQRLYVERGYVPDGLGISCGVHFVKSGETICIDEQTTIQMTKLLAAHWT